MKRTYLTEEARAKYDLDSAQRAASNLEFHRYSEYSIVCDTSKHQAEQFIRVGNIGSAEAYHASRGRIDAKNAHLTQEQKCLAEHYVIKTFGNIVKKNGAMMISRLHNHLFWYQMALVDLPYFRSKWKV